MTKSTPMTSDQLVAAQTTEAKARREAVAGLFQTPTAIDLLARLATPLVADWPDAGPYIQLATNVQLAGRLIQDALTNFDAAFFAPPATPVFLEAGQTVASQADIEELARWRSGEALRP